MAGPFTTDDIQKLVKAQATPTGNSGDSAIVSMTESNAVSPNKAENPVSGTPNNTSVNATGLANDVQSGIKKSNQTLSHACDTGTYVNGAVDQAAAFGGQIIKAIRDGIRAILTALGINPASSALTSKLKKLAQWIKDQTKWIKDITSAINGYLVYVKKIQELISYILSLPAQLIAWFADCLTTLRKQLVASFKTALGDGGTNDAGLADAIKEVQGAISGATKDIATLAATATTAVAATAATVTATTAVFSAAGFGPTKNLFSKA